MQKQIDSEDGQDALIWVELGIRCQKAKLSYFIFFFIFYFFKKFIYLFIFIFGCVGSQFLCEGFLHLRRAEATLHRGAQASHRRGLSRCGAQAPDAQAQQLWLRGLVAPRHVGSSQTRARTRVPCIGRQTLNHCATREAPKLSYFRFLGIRGGGGSRVGNREREREYIQAGFGVLHSFVGLLLKGSIRYSLCYMTSCIQSFPPLFHK